jgi:hypothetical protein
MDRPLESRRRKHLSSSLGLHECCRPKQCAITCRGGGKLCKVARGAGSLGDMVVLRPSPPPAVSHSFPDAHPGICGGGVRLWFTVMCVALRVAQGRTMRGNLRSILWRHGLCGCQNEYPRSVVRSETSLSLSLISLSLSLSLSFSLSLSSLSVGRCVLLVRRERWLSE